MSLIARRTRLPDKRPSVTHKAVIHDGEPQPMELYIICGLHPQDKRPRELFIRTNRDGHNYDQWATALSLIWQIDPGSLEHTIRKFAHIRQAPSGMTNNPQIGFAKSPYDYIMRWLASQFLPRETAEIVGVRFVTEDGEPL